MTSRFNVGDRVRIDTRSEPRHHRVPAFVKGREGIIERVCAAHPPPERVAKADPDGDVFTVYRVRLMQKDLWPDYIGPHGDSLEIEIFEHWLEAVNGDDRHAA